MSVTELHAALTVLKAALPSLETLAEADAHRATLERTLATGTAAVEALERRLTALQSQLADETKAGEVARAKQAKEHGVAISLAEEKIKDLQRSQQTAENQLAATRATIERLRTEATATAEAAEAEAQRRLSGILKAEEEAAARLTVAQEKIKALHGDLAGLSAI